MIDNLSDDYTSQELAYYDSTVTNDNQVP